MGKYIGDCGHGGTDPGASANGLIEKDLNLEQGLYTQKRLKELGVDFALTRTSDKTLTQKQRTDTVKQYDVCLSFHFNAG